MEELIKVNHLNTKFTEEYRKKLPREVFNDVLSDLTSVVFINNLISPSRGYIVDKPIMTYQNEEGEEVEYEDGRREVDLINPHILEDMDYFRERAIFYEKHGKYTNITPNPNPNSDYALFWKEELSRWKYGLVRPDGEWVPGELYYYWNYSRIWLTGKDKNNKSSRRGERKNAFPRPWLGDYLFHHYIHQAKENGQHGKMLKTRGIGFSFKCSSWSPRNMYVFPGSGNPNFHLASDKSFLSGDSGIWGKVVDNLDWIANNTPLPRMRLVNSLKGMEIQIGYQDEHGGRKGLLSSVHGVSLKDNPDKARGVRGPLIHYEEDGLFPQLEKAWGVNRKAVEDGGTAFGFMLAGGTGGVEGKSFDGSERLFYNPGAYNIYPLKNVFDKNADGTTECGYFWGAYMNRNNCYEEKNGEPDIVKSLIEIHMGRYEVKNSSTDANAITQYKAEEPITPQEAIMRTEGTVFPVSDLKEHLENISIRKDSFLAEHLVGDLVYGPTGKVEWRPNSDIYPLRSYDITSGSRHGAVEIFEMPKVNAEGEIANGRYIAGIDPIDSDRGNSLFSVLVMDTLTDRIVAEYTGRPRKASEAYEITLKLLLFYSAQANYESNLKGLFSYFEQRNYLYLLCNTPQILKDMELVKATNLYGNAAKGTRANAAINSWGRQLQADWQLSRVNPDKEDSNLKLHTIRSLAYLEECIKWNSDGNFDRVSAGGMLFILREERYKRIQYNKKNKDKDVNDLTNDKFFEKNYGSNSYL